MAAVEGTRSGDDDGGVPSLASAAFLRLFAAPTAQAIAAAGILVEVLQSQGTPVHASVGTPDTTHVSTDATVVALGHPHVASELVDFAPIAVPDYLDLDDVPPLVQGLTATLQFHEEPSGDAALGLPTNDQKADLASSTLVRGPFSGPTDEQHSWIHQYQDRDERTLRSAIALGCLDAHPGEDMAAAVFRFLTASALPGGPFATDGGTFDVLDVLADRHAGLALAVSCGQESARDTALSTWRREAATVHHELDQLLTEGTIDATEPIRVTDVPLGPLARLVRIVSDEDHAIVLTDGTRLVVAGSREREAATIDCLDGLVCDPVPHGDGRISAIVDAGIDGVVSAVGGGRP